MPIMEGTYIKQRTIKALPFLEATHQKTASPGNLLLFKNP